LRWPGRHTRPPTPCLRTRARARIRACKHLPGRADVGTAVRPRTALPACPQHGRDSLATALWIANGFGPHAHMLTPLKSDAPRAQDLGTRTGTRVITTDACTRGRGPHHARAPTRKAGAQAFAHDRTVASSGEGHTNGEERVAEQVHHARVRDHRRKHVGVLRARRPWHRQGASLAWTAQS